MLRRSTARTLLSSRFSSAYFRRAFSNGTQPNTSASAPAKRRKILGPVFKVVLAGGVLTVAADAALDREDNPHPVYRDALKFVVPFRVTSKAFGWVADLHLPKSFRAPLYNSYSRMFGVNQSEMEGKLEDYECMGDFFARPLKPGLRPLSSNPLVSPCDGTVLDMGHVAADQSVREVKGSNFTVIELLGSSPALQEAANNETPKTGRGELYFCTIYLAPGDYHGFHAPTDVTFAASRHFPGRLLPVAPVVVGITPGLFSHNERVALLGQWPGGFFAYTPVGASNVGSIVVDFQPELRTNRSRTFTEKHWDQAVSLKKGERIGTFRMGSTIVLVFQSPQPPTFVIKKGDKLRLGQALLQ